MCGIAGAFAYSGIGPPIARAELERMIEFMSKRGPDGEGLWISAHSSVGLAHRRLSIIDLSEEGAQPMSINDGELRIVYNGEIYNYRALRQRLEAKGHRFFSSSDTEVLLRLYEEMGKEMVQELRGMFAFSIWDAREKGLFLARDHFGIKPLYYHDDGRVFRWASQARSLLAGGGVLAEPEPAGHVGYYLWGAVPEPYTLYKGLKALPAGHTMWVDDKAPRTPVEYFDVAKTLRDVNRERIDRNEAIEILREALRDSVEHHLIADVPVGSFLSSGVDSASVTALASEIIEDLRTLTLQFTEFTGTVEDEVPYASKIASKYGVHHEIHRVSRADFHDQLNEILSAMDQPSIDGVNTYFVAKAAAASGLKVALSGLGGDELFGGYPSFQQIPRFVSLTRPLSRVQGLGPAFREVSYPLLKRMISPKYAGVIEYGGSYGGAYLLRRGLFMPWELTELLPPEMVQEGWEALQPVIRLNNYVSGLASANTRICALELTHYMKNVLLRDSDWAGMAHSLEIRVPFIDIKVFRALAPILVSEDSSLTKEDLVEVPRQPLPTRLVRRPKTGFAIPVVEWIDSRLEDESRGLRGWAKYVYREFQHN